MTWRVLSLLCCLLCLLSFNLRVSSVPDISYLGFHCQNTTYNPNSAAGSPYRANLNLLLSTLSSNASLTNNHGFYNFTAGHQTSNMVYGLFLCRGDVTTDVCAQCVANASIEILKRCPDEKSAIILYARCLVRYSNQSIFSRVDQSFRFALWNTKNATDPEKFNRILASSMDQIVSRAANGGSGKKFAVQEAYYTPFQRTLYALGQCTPDLSSFDCKTCLRNAIAYIPFCCYDTQGGRVIYPSCNIRYELYPFYNSPVTPAPTPAPAQSPPRPTPAKGPPPLSTPASTKDNEHISNQTIVAIVVPILVATALFLVTFSLAKRARKRYNAIVKTTGGSDFSTKEYLQYNLSQILDATNNFSLRNRIGEGGFGPVYKGILPNGRDVAVKRLSRSSAQGVEEFKNEIALVARLQHRNLVQLLGYCLEGKEKILIYEFVPNRSLDYFLFDLEKQLILDWTRRYNIIGGIARGLLYLHEDSRLTVIHRDLKASNILLDKNMSPKIADFGLAKLFGVDQSQGNTSKIAGTFGYMAPEYALHGQFSIKSDVYSFGVLVLEIVSGKKNSSFYQEHGVDDLLSYAWRQWRNGSPESLLDPTIRDSYARNEVSRSIHIGLLCVQDDAERRPTMASIVVMLNSYSVTAPTPNPPGFFRRSRTQNLPNDQPESDKSTRIKLPSWPSGDEDPITEVYPR